MKHFSFFLAAFFATCVAAYAASGNSEQAQASDGVASIVGQKSSTKGFYYNQMLRMTFMDDCKKDANEGVCLCVLDNLQHQYSEKAFLKIDADLKKKIPHPDFVEYLSNTVMKCDKKEKEEKEEKEKRRNQMNKVLERNARR